MCLLCFIAPFLIELAVLPHSPQVMLPICRVGSLTSLLIILHSRRPSFLIARLIVIPPRATLGIIRSRTRRVVGERTSPGETETLERTITLFLNVKLTPSDRPQKLSTTTCTVKNSQLGSSFRNMERH